MLKKISKKDLFLSDQGWLQSYFHFSFAEYRNPKNVNFGVLRVLNDDTIHPSSGFGTHPHRDMEIISYIIDGNLTHKDSMGHEETLTRGEVQYLSAGSGIYHSEYNHHDREFVRLLQIWILPPKKNLKQLYGSYEYKEEDRKNQLLNIVSSQNGTAKIKIYQDIDIYASELDAGKVIDYEIPQHKQIYFVQIEGKSNVNEILLERSDALEIQCEKKLHIEALEDSHFLFIEMQADT
ncbi:MAG: pirin family protein [Sulfurospirillaceae bacterium]|nr:pirin family protein [Sulfurospirillaceae bacterium]